MKARLLLPLILVAMTWAWVGSASAFSISFIEPISPTANIAVTTDISGSTITTSPELANLSASIPELGILALSTIVALREGSLTGPVSDLLIVVLTPTGALLVSFQSDAEAGLPGGGGIVNLVETGLPQLALSVGLGDPFVSLSITTQSDLDLAPVPEPATLLLFGSSLAGVGVLWRRRRQN